MTPLDSRTWLLWGLCCIVPMLVTRHPLLVLQMLFIVVTVRIVCIPPHAVRWGWIIRIAILFAAIGVVINAATVRSGNQIAFTLPWGWDITWNAIAYGIVSGFAMVCLVLIGTTSAAGLDWVALVRVLPARLAPLAVSASVAWSFLPSASQALTDIREAQAARGHTLRSGKDALPILIPLLDGSLGRALTMSEALEARGFGASAGTKDQQRNHFAFAGMVLIASLVLLAYGFSLSNSVLSYASTMISLAAIAIMMRSPVPSHRSTRYREHLLTRPDVIVMVASSVSLILFLALFATSSQSVTFNPYPNLEVPAIDFRFLVALMPLLAPALFPYREVTG